MSPISTRLLLILWIMYMDVCLSPAVTKTGSCPDEPSDLVTTCDVRCIDDNKCPGSEKCCHWGCSIQCRAPKELLPVCLVGTFGANCSLACHCAEPSSCDPVTGLCSSAGCELGFKGWPQCRTPCEANSFGRNCEHDCHCDPAIACDSRTGICAFGRCKPGYQMLNKSCKTYCPQGTFGQNCAGTCHCADPTCWHTNGVCMAAGCEIGWTGTRSCQTPCAPNTYGRNCAFECHCDQPSACEHKTGVCAIGRCESGYLTRNKTCQTPCEPGTFGVDCGSTCHCADQSSCDPKTGSCSSAGCQIGWKGDPNCQIPCTLGTFGVMCLRRQSCADDPKEVDPSLGDPNPDCGIEATAGPGSQISSDGKDPESAIHTGLVIAVGILAFLLAVATITAFVFFLLWRGALKQAKTDAPPRYIDGQFYDSGMWDNSVYQEMDRIPKT